MNLQTQDLPDGLDLEPARHAPNLWFWLLVCALLTTVTVLTWESLAGATVWIGPVAPP